MGPHGGVRVSARPPSQVSAEMGDFDARGELLHEKAIGFLRSLFRRWKALGVSHSLTIILFCRCNIDDGASAGGQQPFDCAALMTDKVGRQYSDYYQLVAENESRADWEPLLPTLKRHFLSFGPSLKRRGPTTSSLPDGAEAGRGAAAVGAAADDDEEVRIGVGTGGSGAGGGVSSAVGGGGVGGGVSGSRRNSTAAYGNLLEAINLALDVLESSNEEVSAWEQTQHCAHSRTQAFTPSRLVPRR